MGLLLLEHRLRLGLVPEPQPVEQVLVLCLALPELELQVRPAAQPPVHLDIPELLVDAVPAAQPDPDDRKHQPDPGDHAAGHDRQRPEVDDVRRLEPEHRGRDGGAGEDQAHRPPRERLPADLRRNLEADLDLILEHRSERLDPRPYAAQSLDVGAQHWQRRGRRMGPVQLLDLVAHDDGRPIPLESLLRRIPLRRQPLRLARLLEHRAPLAERRLRLGSPFAGHGERVAIALEPAERILARLELRSDIVDRVLGDLEPARVPGAPGLEIVERAVELLAGPAGAAVRTADGCLQAIPEGRLVALETGQLVMANRCRGPEEGFRRDTRQLGERLVGAGRIGDRLALELQRHLAPRATERLLEAALVDPAVLVLVGEGELEHRPRVGVAVPRDEPVEVRGGARDLAGQGKLDGPLERRLARLVRAADDGQARGQLDLLVAVAAEVVDRDPRDPHSVTS